jgi:hypothetical protein
MGEESLSTTGIEGYQFHPVNWVMLVFPNPTQTTPKNANIKMAKFISTKSCY